MIFDDLRVKKICNIMYYTPIKMNFSSKNRRDYIIGIKCKGSADHYFADRKFTLKENMIYFFNKTEDYEVKVLEKSLSYSIHFSIYEDIETPSFCLKVSDTTSIIKTIEKIDMLFKSENKTTVKVLKEFYKLIALYEELYQKRYTPKNSKMLRAKEYINLHFKEEDCIPKVIELCGLSKRRFGDLFRENFDITPNQYIIALKIKLAKELLILEEMTVSSVAEICGISDIYYFSKLFKKETGLSPTKYRKKEV